MRAAYLAAVVCLCLSGCAGQQGAPPVPTSPSSPGAPADPPPAPAPPGPPTYDLERLGLPRFVTADYIDLGPIAQISRFRSGQGHSYADDFETCRSMKHYYRPRAGANWSAIPIFAPATGTVVHMHDEWAGTQVHISPSGYPAFRIVLFHVNVQGLAVEQPVESGQRIGTHIGTQTWSDVAVRVDTPAGFRLVSWFDVMTDPVFDAYRARGVAQRADLIISRELRDAHPLTCSGESFAAPSTLENWFTLR